MNRMETIMDKNCERLSALMDGELDPKELDALLAAVNKDESLLREWHDWRLAGDVVQGETHCAPGFMGRFSERLAAEPVVVAPKAQLRRPRRLLIPLAMAASVALVGIVVWRIEPVSQELNPAAQYAAETEATLHAYLAAHRESDGDPFGEGEEANTHFFPVKTY